MIIQEHSFFLKWCAVINSTMTNMERGLLIGYILLIIYYLIKGNKKERTFFFATTISINGDNIESVGDGGMA